MTELIGIALQGNLFKLYCMSVFPYLWIFTLGCAISANAEKIIPITTRIWPIALLLALIIKWYGFDFYADDYPIIFCFLCMLGVIGFAYRHPECNVKVDISYSLYVYHMVFVNAFIAFGLTNRYSYLFLCSIFVFVFSCVMTKTLGDKIKKIRLKYDG